MKRWRTITTEADVYPTELKELLCKLHGFKPSCTVLVAHTSPEAEVSITLRSAQMVEVDIPEPAGAE